jgi:hypothetical protein
MRTYSTASYLLPSSAQIGRLVSTIRMSLDKSGYGRTDTQPPKNCIHTAIVGLSLHELLNNCVRTAHSIQWCFKDITSIFTRIDRPCREHLSEADHKFTGSWTDLLPHSTSVAFVGSHTDVFKISTDEEQPITVITHLQDTVKIVVKHSL